MLARTQDPNNRGYVNYGGRGISVCDAWQYFEGFAADMGPTFSPELELDRHPNNDGNYEPGNCRWATRAQQQRNKRSNHVIEWRDKRMTVTDWACLLGIQSNTLIYRIRRGWPIERAMTYNVNPRVLLEIANRPICEEVA